MIERPQPKAEIAVKVTSWMIFITYASEDARAFVMRECRQFGSVFDQNNGHMIYLYVSDLYDPAQVGKWILSYND